MIFATLISTFRDILQQRKIRNPTRSLKTANNNQSVYSHGGSAGAAVLQCAVFPALLQRAGAGGRLPRFKHRRRSLLTPARPSGRERPRPGWILMGLSSAPSNTNWRTSSACLYPSPLSRLQCSSTDRNLTPLCISCPFLSLDKVQCRQIMVVSSIQLNLQKLQKNDLSNIPAADPRHPTVRTLHSATSSPAQPSPAGTARTWTVQIQSLQTSQLAEIPHNTILLPFQVCITSINEIYKRL